MHFRSVGVAHPATFESSTLLASEGIWHMAKLAGRSTAVALALALNTALSCPVLAWGDEGHAVVALVAQSFLDPSVRRKASALLAADTDSLTAHDIAAEATWADKFRDSNRDGARERTHRWHFVDIEITDPNLNQACFGHPPVPSGTPASLGPANDCVIDKIQEFADELASPATDPEEQIVALKFLLHFVGDLHQPLHASDDNDRGGNGKRVSAAGFKAGNLHHFWDTVFVEQLEPNANSIASDLIGHITENQVRDWSQGGPSDWAEDSFTVAQDDVYGQLPTPNARGTYRLPDDYVAMATQDVAIQLSKAGVRLAFMLNRALGQNR
jgi:S1/P1 Nuclease